MTGGGFGRCSGTATVYGSRPRFGRGGGWGRGWGSGQGRSAWGGYAPNAAMQPMDETSTKNMLDDRIAALSQELEQIRKQRETLD